MEWRITGVRRWIPVVFLGCFVANSVLRVVGHDAGTRWPPEEVAFLVFCLVGSALGVVMVVAAWYPQVRLGTTGIEVRGGRRKHIPYDEITRVYRDRFAAGGVTLMLADDRTLVLPAPVAGLGVGSPTVDDAVEQIRARLPAGDPG